MKKAFTRAVKAFSSRAKEVQTQWPREPVPAGQGLVHVMLLCDALNRISLHHITPAQPGQCPC
jgi:hypothetical protein